MNNCKFCHQDESGNYNMINFTKEDNPSEWVHLYAYGGDITHRSKFLCSRLS